MSATNARVIFETVKQVLEPSFDPSYLLQYLIQIQAEFSCIPQAAIRTLHEELHISPVQIKSVVSFYSFLTLEYQGKFRVLFSDNITDRLAGNQQLFDQLTHSVNHADVTIEFTSCSGLCDQGPGLLVNGLAISRLDSNRISEIATLINSETPLSDWPVHLFNITDNIQRSDMQLNVRAGNGIELSRALDLGAKKVLQVLQDSGLRGRGGAGFETAKKWNLCKQSKENERFVVCNADEGEPGTFKDRVLLNSSAHSVIEGMTVCAYVIGAQKGFIYLRGEYLYLLESLNKVIKQRRELGLLGNNIHGKKHFKFDIEIHLGAGAYICGEESALIESLEGKRGIPRIRPPFPVTEGYKNKPTVVNNVETFWSVSRIMSKGANWFKQSGTEKSTGTRLLSISGDCASPGIFEYPFGISLKQILSDCGGGDAQAVQMAGAAGTLVLAKDFNRTMSFEDLATGGSFMVIGPHRNLMDLLQNFADFFKHESCGFCTPCRVGTSQIADIIRRFNDGQGSYADLNHLQEISLTMLQSSFCGLGCSAPAVLMNMLEDSPELFENLMSDDPVNPSFDLDKAVIEFKTITKSA